MVNLELDEWLRPSDLNDGEDTEVVFLDEGDYGEIPANNGKDAVQTFEIKVSLSEDVQRTWTMNKTSQRAVATLHGTDTSKWVGKKATLFVAVQNVAGKMRDVVYARAK